MKDKIDDLNNERNYIPSGLLNDFDSSLDKLKIRYKNAIEECMISSKELDSFIKNIQVYINEKGLKKKCKKLNINIY